MRLAACFVFGWLVCGACAGCVQEMANQPRVDTYEASAFFDDGLGARPAVPGTIARGSLIEEGAVATGRREGEPVAEIPVQVTAALQQRGRERYAVFCRHCHGPAGYGDGLVVQRGFPAPPSYHIERLRDAPDGHIFRVITDGLGRMPAFSARIPPADRWAILTYVRALQLSQYADVDELSQTDRAQLENEE